MIGHDAGTDLLNPHAVPSAPCSFLHPLTTAPAASVSTYLQQKRMRGNAHGFESAGLFGATVVWTFDCLCWFQREHDLLMNAVGNLGANCASSSSVKHTIRQASCKLEAVQTLQKILQGTSR
jgi:hypothetical protein